MARRRTFLRGGRQVRESLWIGLTETNSTLASANASLLINSLSAGGIDLLPFTIVRTRGILAFRSDQTGASESFHAGFGVCVVSQQAAAIGITAVPTPMFDLGSDLFFVHQLMAGRFEFVSGTGFDPQAMNMVQYDSKAMRKVNDDEDVVLTLETSSLSSGINIYHAGRMLIKLH